MIPNSVSALKARRRAKTPELPLELWLVIFDHATYVPGIFIPEIYTHSSSLEYGFNRYHYPLIRRALVTKRYLVRVCKQWWHLATPFLYRSIFIGRGRCISSLARTLALSASGNGVLRGERPLGSYTERLDIAMRDHRHAYYHGDLELLAEVIKHLQNLAVVSFDVTPPQYTPSDLCDTVIDALIYVAPSIKIVHWSVPRLLPRPQSLQNLVTATQLHVLHCTHHLKGSAGSMDNCTLSSCTTLAVTSDDIFYQLSSAQLPALRELIYHERVGGASPHLSRFLERHGKNLTSIHLSWSPSGQFPGKINLLPIYCQNLRRFTIMLYYWELLHAEIFEHVPIEYLGLGCLQQRSPTKTYKKITFPTLVRLKDANPALRTIRFINYLNVNDLLRNHHKALLPALELLSGSNFRLEDHEGQLLSDRVVPSDA